MADLTIPKGQTYPYIRGYVADEDGAMNAALQAADAIALVVDDGAGTNPIELTVTYVDSDETFDLDGQEIPVNWQADYSESALSSTQRQWRGKLKILHPGGLVQYCPKDGFIEIDITANVTESAP